MTAGGSGVIDTSTGRARLAGRRLLVWVLCDLRRAGDSDEAIAANYDLTTEQISAAWAYEATHRAEIDLEIARNGDERRGPRPIGMPRGEWWSRRRRAVGA